MKSASAYQRKSLILFQAVSKTTDGLGTLTGPCIVVFAGDADHILGRALRLALRGSKKNLPHPTTWSALPDPRLDATGIKSWRTFSRLARCVGIRLEGDMLRMTPKSKLNPKGGYEELPDKQLTAVSPPDYQIGAMLREAFAQTE